LSTLTGSSGIGFAGECVWIGSARLTDVSVAARLVCSDSRKRKVNAMEKQTAEKDKPAKQAKPAKPAAQDEAQAKPKKPKPDGAGAKEKEPAKAKEEKAKPAPRPPVDRRLKVLKKFHGKFLPRGPLRDRHKALMARWNSGEDHGGVTVEELKSLYDDWVAARAKPARVAATSR
jgi:hypothetical protein